MESYPAPARALVAEMTAAAAREPHRAVAFQGAPGANSHIAVNEAFPDGLPLPCFSFEDAIDAVREQRADCAMIPIENSLHGRVADMHFLLPESGLVITGEHFLPIRYALMGLDRAATDHRGDEPPAGARPVPPLAARARARPVPYPDTAGAAALVAERGDPATAAIAPLASARSLWPAHPGRGARGRGAQHDALRRAGARRAGAGAGRRRSMTTLIFEVKNVPAALYKAMGGFATNGVNMTKLESYQRGESFAATEFYADIEGHPDDPGVRRSLEELAFHTKWVRMLGTYPQARERKLD